MLKANERYVFDRMNSTAQKYKLGQKINEKLGVKKGIFDFSDQGGAAGYITLKDDRGDDVTVPDNAIVKHSYYDVVTELQPSGGTPAVSIGLQSDGDIVASVTKTVGQGDGTQDGAAANMLKLTAERTLRLKVASADLTAGKLAAFLEYVISE